MILYIVVLTQLSLSKVKEGIGPINSTRQCISLLRQSLFSDHELKDEPGYCN